MSNSTITLRLLEPPPGETVEPTTNTDTAGSLFAASGRYVLLDELARGGMGVVFAASDLELNRNVAVKVLRKEFQNNPEVVQWFLEEAQITGTLQHPGVPSVHNLGALPDGRPFLVMKLIEGRTLARLLLDRPDPAKDLPQFLRIFEQVCQTAAYAHAQKVIHRDLKPSNVMVGAFGEVQVMDWGLARVLTDGPSRGAGAAEQPLDQTGGVGEPADDLVEPPGRVLGTLAYMPPEQARGTADAVDTRADVFALGGILCELLTGAPPFTGSQSTVRALARAGQLGPGFARLDASGADPELVALAKWCLSPNPTDRPADAGLVAAAVAAYRVGVERRLHTAEVERAEAAVRQIERGKRRRVHLGVAAVGVLLVLAAAAAAWWEDHRAADRRAEKQREAARTWEAINAGLGEAEAALRDDDLRDADSALARVRVRSGADFPDDLRDRLDSLTRDREMAAAIEVLTDTHRTNPAAGGDLLRAIDSQDYAEVFRRYGLDLRSGDPTEMAARINASPIRSQLLDGLDAALGHYGFSAVEIPRRLPDLIRQVDGDPVRNQVRDAVFTRDPVRLLTLVRGLDPTHLTPGFAVLLIGQQYGLPLADRLRVLTAAYDRHPDNFRVNQLLCLIYLSSGREVTAETHAAAITHARILVALRPASPTGYRLLGSALKRADQPQAAMAALRKAVELTAGADRTCGIKYQIGTLIRQQSGPEAAVAYFREEVGRTPRDAYAHWNLGRGLREGGNLDEALACFRRAIDLLPTEGAFYPTTAELLRQRDELEEAVGVYRRAGDRARPLRWSHIHGLAPVLTLQGKYREAVETQERLIALFPDAARAVNTQVRYHAACAAALAGTTGGIDPYPRADRPAVRRKALNWLRDDLAGSRVEFAIDPGRTRPEANARMRQWIAQPAFAGVRHPFFLTALPPEEAKEWLTFWDEVRAFRDHLTLPEAPPPRERMKA